VRPISNYTLLEEGEVLVDGEPKPMLEINPVPGEYSDMESLEFDWEVLNFTSSQLVIQLIWKNAHHVSMWSKVDNIEVIIHGYHLFADLQGSTVEPEARLVSKFVPPQTDEKGEELAEIVANILLGAIAATYASTFIVQLWLAGSLNAIFG